jgi:hypothetical protein
MYYQHTVSGHKNSAPRQFPKQIKGIGKQLNVNGWKGVAGNDATA